ncbi:zinc ribbon domain-containing protein [Escherichia coli]|uniref:Zinc-ribbon domain-containing protein n=1 Tax=Escherichia coli TaxID=562 RepID=A0A6G6ALS6_ECOLX|nr:zinc ribbon domain-containing protein [Salmonella enterica]EFO2096836.1 zinc ribbon domain-containing protein [Escherichia coli O19]EFO2116333.1 zinc ribbon domain-containing protein [Escherichia coli O106]EFO2250660.1 zinc ribbon domain-containing protein [Escherichia coli]EBJ0253278.1 zinc ribbon domain-containing protein [Salmonella enterica]
MSSMVYCRGCGKEIHETAKSCPHCGATNASSGSGEKSRIAAALLGKVRISGEILLG